MMNFQVGQRVTLVGEPDSWCDTCGVGVVVDPMPNSDLVHVDVVEGPRSGGGWYQAKVACVPADDTHTDADLAMALELADLMDAEGRGGELDFEGHPIYNPCGPSCLVCTADWLRTEVRNALLERAQ